MSDPAVNPKHYVELGNYSAVHVIEKWGLGYHLGQTLKYIQRAGKKAGESDVRDLKKAKWYLERAIYLLDSNEPDPAEKPPSYTYTVVNADGMRVLGLDNYIREHYDCWYLVKKYADDLAEYVWDDGMEPEDAVLVRDLKGLVDLLNDEVNERRQ